MFTVLLLCSTAAFASPVTIKAVGVNQEVLFEKSVGVGGMNLGQWSDQTFSDALATGDLSDYQGNVEGVLSLDHLGNGLEIISQTEMNTFGWCYLVDGASTNTMANDYHFTGQEQVVEWFYAYSHLNGSQWSEMCTPADHLPPPSASGHHGSIFILPGTQAY